MKILLKLLALVSFIQSQSISIDPDSISVEISPNCIPRQTIHKEINTIMKANFGFGDLNCTILAVKNNRGEPMTLRQIGERLGVSFVRVKQIEDELLKKLAKTKFIDK